MNNKKMPDVMMNIRFPHELMEWIDEGAKALEMDTQAYILHVLQHEKTTWDRHHAILRRIINPS